jgi:phosphatidylethanolamine-binding protein (PEBP) family uncharacterized protein
MNRKNMLPIEVLLSPLGRAFRNRRSGDATSITNFPELATAELVLVFEDIDGPGADPRIHTIAEFTPIGDGIAEGALTLGAPEVSFAPRNGRPAGYAGPRPLPGHGTHHYRFHLYAIDTSVDLGAIAAPEQLPPALAGHVLGSGLLIGTRKS